MFLCLDGKSLDMDSTLHEAGSVDYDSALSLESMQVFVKDNASSVMSNRGDEEGVAILVSPTSTIAQVKSRIKDKLGLSDIDEPLLCFQDKQLQDESTISQCQIDKQRNSQLGEIQIMCSKSHWKSVTGS